MSADLIAGMKVWICALLLLIVLLLFRAAIAIIFMPSWRYKACQQGKLDIAEQIDYFWERPWGY